MLENQVEDFTEAVCVTFGAVYLNNYKRLLSAIDASKLHYYAKLSRFLVADLMRSVGDHAVILARKTWQVRLLHSSFYGKLKKI